MNTTKLNAMKRNLQLFLSSTFLFSVLQVSAQSKYDSIQYYLASRPPAEHIHLHIDKEIYFPGETIWFKGYLLAEGKISMTSSNLFTELLDDSGHKIAGFTSPIIDGTSNGQFTIPDSIKSQELTIRSFTKFMLEDSSIIPFTVKIRVVNDEVKTGGPAKTGYSLQLFPEGGTLLNNVANLISFKAMASNGMPYEITGALKDNRNVFIDSIHATHDGMGSFEFYPLENESYYVEWKDPQRRDQENSSSGFVVNRSIYTSKATE